MSVEGVRVFGRSVEVDQANRVPVRDDDDKLSPKLGMDQSRAHCFFFLSVDPCGRDGVSRRDVSIHERKLPDPD